MSSKEWLAERLTTLNASEWGVILGLSRWSSPYALWHKKVSGDVEDEDNELLKFGRDSEAMNLRWFVDKVKLPCVLNDGFEREKVVLEGVPLAATVDAKVAETGDPIELKCAFSINAKEWKHKLPLLYQAQLQATMLCCGASQGYFSAFLFDGFSVSHKWYKAARNDRFIEGVWPQLKQFWSYVESKEPPPVDFSEHTRKALQSQYKTAKPTTVDLPAEFDVKHAKRESIIKRLKQLEKQKDQIDNELRAAIGDNECGVLTSGDEGYYWRQTKKGRSFRHGKVKQSEHSIND